MKVYLTIACIILATIKAQSLIELEDLSEESNLRFLQNRPSSEEAIKRAQASADKAKLDFEAFTQQLLNRSKL